MVTVSRRLRAAVPFLVALLMVSLPFAASVAYTQHVDTKRRADAAAADRQRAEAVEAARLRTCRLIEAQLRAFAENPPPTQLGRDIQAAWAELGIENRCIVAR